MGAAFVALKRGRGQGGFEGASPQRAVTEKPTQPPAPFQCNPEGNKGHPHLISGSLTVAE